MVPSRLVHNLVTFVASHRNRNTVTAVMQCLLPAEAGILPRAAEEEVAFKVNMLSRIWDICKDLTLDHLRASREVVKT